MCVNVPQTVEIRTFQTTPVKKRNNKGYRQWLDNG